MSKITAYTQAGLTAGNDVLPFVDVSDTTMAASGTTKKMLMSQLPGTTSWVNAVALYGVDLTGATDSTTALQNAVNAMPSSGGVVYIPTGSPRFNSTVTISNPAVTLLGDGMWSTTLNYYGSGDFIRMYSANPYTSGYGGGILGLMIDGTNASAGACGTHVGDIYQFRCDFGVRKFQGSNSRGVWFDNQYYWHENMSGHLFVQQNTANLIFDNSANATGQSTGSFARTTLTVVMDAKGVGDGVILKNGAQIYAGQFSLQGNMDYSTTGTKYWAVTLQAPAPISFTATSATPCVFTASGHYYGNGTAVFLAGTAPTGFTNGQSYFVVNTNIGAGTFQLSATVGGSAIASTSTGSGTVETFTATTMRHSVLNINVECNATTGTQPGTINFTSSGSATGYNAISGCTGIIDFSANNAFALTSNPYGNFYFDGPVYGDSSLWRSIGLGTNYYSNGSLASSTQIYATGVARSLVSTSSNLTGMILQSGSADTQLVVVENSGTGTITFAALGTSHVRNGTSCTIAANSAMMFQWDTNQSSWYQVGGSGGGAALDTTAADIQPAGVQAAGAVGLGADSGHVHPNESDLSLYLAPTGATAESFPRSSASAYSSVLISGTVYVSAIGLPKGLPVSNLGIMIGNTAFATVTHGWFALLDSAGVVRAVTADQTTALQTSFSVVKLAVGSLYTTTAAGPFYLAFCATAGTMGVLVDSPSNLSTPLGVAPVLCGTASTATTPPATGTTLTISYASGNPRFYGYTA